MSHSQCCSIQYLRRVCVFLCFLRQVEQRKKQPQLTVFEEGEGGRVGCRQGYWQQHYVRERNVAVAVEGATGDRKDESYRKDLDVWRTPDNEVLSPFFPFPFLFARWF